MEEGDGGAGQDLPEHSLVRGQVGTVVEDLESGAYEIEFCDDDGRTYAMASLKADQIMRLHDEPIHEEINIAQNSSVRTSSRPRCIPRLSAARMSSQSETTGGIRYDKV